MMETKKLLCLLRIALAIVATAVVVLIFNPFGNDEADYFSGTDFGPGSVVILSLDETLDRINRPFAVVEVEILDLTTLSESQFHAPTLMPGPRLFHNARVTTIYYEAPDFAISSEYIIFMSTYLRNDMDFKPGDRFICLLTSAEEHHGEEFRGIYGSYAGRNSVFNIIKGVDGRDYITQKWFSYFNTNINGNLFGLDLPSAQKEALGILPESDDSSEAVINAHGDFEYAVVSEVEPYVAEREAFTAELVNHVRAFMEQRSSIEEYRDITEVEQE